MEKICRHSPEQDDADFDRVVEEALATVLERMPKSRQAEALRQLRAELEHCLTEAPSTGDAVGAVALRARLAAAFARKLGSTE